jgi:hypothetical protein
MAGIKEDGTENSFWFPATFAICTRLHVEVLQRS